MQLVLQVLDERLRTRKGLPPVVGGADGDLGAGQRLAEVDEGLPVAEVLDLLDAPGLPEPLVDPVEEEFLREK